jgi:hypothetical protein
MSAGRRRSDYRKLRRDDSFRKAEQSVPVAVHHRSRTGQGSVDGVWPVFGGKE